ncbi:hypothetical protein PRIPAC_83024, partial [Pristionchus pacificus]
RSLIKDYPYVAMDTELPKPLGQFKSKEDFNYQQVSCNVNMLKLIQVGFALVSDKGELPPSGDVWQLNFMFSLGEDMFSQECGHVATCWYRLRPTADRWNIHRCLRRTPHHLW